MAEYSGNGTLLATYLHGPGVDEPLSVTRSGVTSYFQRDALGSVVQTYSSSGVNSTYKYDSYGRIVAQTGTAPGPYAFTGREYDAESGLYYYRARYYSPDLGRFISEDPIGLKGGRNLYSYAMGNPSSRTDPSGLFSWKDACRIGGDVVLSGLGIAAAFRGGAFWDAVALTLGIAGAAKTEADPNADPLGKALGWTGLFVEPQLGAVLAVFGVLDSISQALAKDFAEAHPELANARIEWFDWGSGDSGGMVSVPLFSGP